MILTLLFSLLLLGNHEPTTPSQEDPITPRAIQRRHLEWERTTLLAMAEAMPEELYRDSATPEQRDFAQQVHHAAGFAPIVCAGYLTDAEPNLPDTTIALNSTEGLVSFLNAAYDFAIEALESHPEEDRGTLVDFIGGVRIPKAEALDQAHLHAAWTMGQLVANFRKQGMAPPAFTFF
jgi:hypothetical protein